jgi:hypothetical protein
MYTVFCKNQNEKGVYYNEYYEISELWNNFISPCCTHLTTIRRINKISENGEIESVGITNDEFLKMPCPNSPMEYSSIYNFVKKELISYFVNVNKLSNLGIQHYLDKVYWDATNDESNHFGPITYKAFELDKGIGLITYQNDKFLGSLPISGRGCIPFKKISYRLKNNFIRHFNKRLYELDLVNLINGTVKNINFESYEYYELIVADNDIYFISPL